MEENMVTFPLGFEDSQAYNSVNRLANYTQKRLGSINFGASGANAFEKMSGQARQFSQTLEFANDRLVAFAATTTIIYGLGAAFTALAKNAINAEKALAEIQVNVKLTSQEMNALTADLFKAANATGNSFFVAAEAAAEFGRQGLKVADISKATTAALTLTQISGMDVANSVKSLTAAVNTFGKDAVNYESLVNKMAAADTNFAVSSKDIAEAIGRVGSTAQDAGINIDQLIALVTSVQQTTARGGAAIGNSFKNIFTRLQRDDVANSIENLGIKTKNADGSFINQIDVLKELAGAYDNLSDSQQANISEKLGGVYQINIVKALINDLSKATSVYGQALGIVGRAQNEAFVKSGFLGRTAVNKINEAKNSFIQFSEAIGKLGLNGAIGDIAGSISGIFQSVAEPLSKDKGAASIGEQLGQSLVKGIINAISGPGLAVLGVRFAKLAGSVLNRFTKDVGGTLFGGDIASTKSKMATLAEENRQRLIGLSQESQFYKILSGENLALEKQLGLVSKISSQRAATGLSGAINVSSQGVADNRGSTLFLSSSKEKLPAFNSQLMGMDNSTLISYARKNKLNPDVQRELDRRGISGNAGMIGRGFNMTMLNRNAVRDLSNNQNGQYSDIASRGAANFLNSTSIAITPKMRSGIEQNISGQQNSMMVKNFIAEREAKLAREAKSAEVSKAGRTFFDGRQANFIRQEDRSRFISANVKGPPIPNVKAEDLMASSHFANYMANNPTASSKDIQAAALLSSKETGGTVKSQLIAQQIRDARKNRWDQHSAKVGKFGFFGLGLGGGVLGSAIGEETGDQISNGASTIGTAVALGSSVGPIGTAVGAIVGSSIAFSSAIKKSTIKMADLAKSVNDLQVDVEKQQNAIQAYLSSNEKLDSVTKNPNSTDSQIKSAARDKASSLLDLPSEVRAKILQGESIGGERGKAISNDAINEFSKSSTSKLNSETALGSIIANADKNNNDLALAWRKLTRFSPSSQGGISQLNDTELNKSVSTFAANFDFKKLKEYSSAGNSTAQDALAAFDSGNFKEFIQTTSYLRLTSREASDSILALKASNDQLNNAFKRAKISIDQLDKAQQEEEAKAQRTKAAFEDFQKYEGAASRRNALSGAIGSSRNSLLNARLGIVANQEGTKDFAKQNINYQQQLNDLNLKEQQIKLKTSEDITSIIGKVYSTAGRTALNNDNGNNFVSDFLKSGLSPDNIEKQLDDIVSNLENAKSYSESEKNEIIKVSNDLKVQTLEIRTQKQILQEQLKATLEISRKQKFDKLIDSILGRDAFKSASENVDFTTLKNLVLNPTREQSKKDNEAFVLSRRNGNADPFLAVIARQIDQQKQLLESNSTKISKGQQGLNASELSIVTDSLRRNQNVLEFSSQADLRRGNSQGFNQGTGTLARQAIERSKLIAAGEFGGKPGSIDNLKLAAQELYKAAQVITDTKNSDRKNLLDFANDIVQGFRPQVGLSGTFNTATDMITKAIVENPTSKDRLFEAQRGLEAGRVNDAKYALSSDPKFQPIIDEINRANGLSEQAFKNSEGRNAMDKAGVIDWQPFKDSISSVNTSNIALRNSLGSLDAQVFNLTSVMEKQSRIAGLSADTNFAKNQLDTNQQALNKLKSQGIEDPTQEQINRANKNSTDKTFYDRLSGLYSKGDVVNGFAGTGSVSRSIKDKASDETVKLMIDILKTGRLSGKENGTSTEQDYLSVKQKIDSLKDKYKNEKSPERVSIDRFERENLEILRRQSKISPSLNEDDKRNNEAQAAKLLESIEKLRETIESIDKKRAIEQDSDPAKKTFIPETTGQAPSIDININGADILPGLSEAMRKTAIDYINLFNTNKPLFEAGAVLS